ncbi:MAG: hypothetical protein K2X27_21055 [Candidatus Obscuribacterales bacterium]|nr:hypothetical protein [Candidatus Obscuribacterales bacterium]
MENQRAEQYFSPIDSHEDSVTVNGLDDLFQWASETVAEGLDGRARRAKEQRVKRQVLNIIHRSADLQAKAKHADELAYLQRRVIALQGVLAEKSEEVANLKQVVLAQYHGLQRIPELEEKVHQLESLTWYREQAEEERKHLMNALAKLKKERDYLEDLVTVNETENSRLALLLNEAKQEIAVLKARRWWHYFFPPKKS